MPTFDTCACRARAGGSSTPTDKKHLLGTPHARGPNKSLDRLLRFVGQLIGSDGVNCAVVHALRPNVEPVLRKLFISHR